ncbi:DMT family transporter [Azohydromonas caseinilytica]|uniref:DMT family transporter n=1 Tax=Azohydromonas caseinilytica TaxID=2728836 RepID=A0A848F4L7_9BURK|nr:DMT family transporter [Azohydromonas caseinilytica]NML15007.1 DMT family transporter [Azohydromonas caseinilytica]
MRIAPRTAVLLTVPPLLWAGNAVVGRLLVGSVPPLTLNFLRWLLAALLLLPLGWRVLRAPGTLRGRWPYLLLTGTLGVGLYNALQYLALVSSTPINVTLIASSMPVWMLAVGALFYREHPGPRQLLGALLSLAGVLFVIARGDAHALLQVRFVRGDLYVIVAIISWAFYSWLLARPPASMRGAQRPHWHWAEALLLQILFGLLGAGAAAGLEQAAGTHAIRWSSSWTLAGLAYVVVGPALVAFRCWGLGVATAGPALAAFFSNLTPLFAALMSAAVLGEPPRWYHGVAFALIVAGIVVSGRRG